MFGGNNPQLGATSTPAKPGGLFSSFSGAASTPGFGNAAPAAAPAFGATSAFGTTSFGAPAQTTAAPTLGGFGGFGAAATSNTTTAPTLGGFGGFGSSQTNQAAPNSLFGQASAAAGNKAPTAFGGFGGFGSTTTNQAAPAFGATAASTSSGFGGFGAATSTTTAPPTFSGFGQQQQQQQQQQNTGFGGFGTGGSNFGSMFPKLGQTSTVTPGFGGFGNTNFMMGQPQQQAPQISPDEAFAQSIYNVCVYGDERDTILAKWNFLQASWGCGKAFYSQNANPVELTPQNYLCRFKAIGYSRLPGKDNKMGLVALNFNKTLNELKTQQQQIMTALNNIFGNKPNFVISIESNKDLDDKKSQLVIYVEEKLQMSLQTKRIPATDVANYLNQANIKPQLGNMGVYEVLALVLPDEDQLKEYLEKPPKGINAHMWNQAQLDNPNPRLFIPVPLVGFSDLKNRIKCQESEVDMHALYMEKLDSHIAQLRKRHANATAKIMEHKRLIANVTHRLLKIIVKQECTRKLGLALTPEEEVLRTKLENMQAVVSAPTQFKGRLSELLSQMRMQRNQYALTNGADYTLDKDSEDEMKTFLTMQQKAIEVLIDTVTNDMKAINIILDGLPSLTRT